MSIRAFACCAAHTGQVLGYVSQGRVEEWPPELRIVRLRFGGDWRCALLDRSRLVEVDGMLLRDAVPSDDSDCPECAQPAASPVHPAAPDSAPEPEAAPESSAPPRTVQAAAISMLGRRMVVVLVRRDIIDSPGEAALMQGAFERQFGGTPVLLMGQDEDGSAHYRGEPELVRLLDGVPVERMPWKAYPAP